VKKYSILFAIFILAIVLIAGCGGGGGTTGVVPNNVTTNPADPTPTPGTLVQVPGNPTNPGNPTLPSNLPTGTFKVEVKFPGAGAGADIKELIGSDLPYNSHTLKVTITGEAIATSIMGERNDLDPTGAGTYTLTVPNVPVGLNTATIEVLDPGGNLLCQRKHGFYMTPGATEGPGLILLGVAIQGDGSYVPVNIDIPAGSSISFQNHDYTNDRTASMNGGAVTVGPIGHATHITQPVTAEVFPAENHLFNTSGQFNYDGQSGRVLVYGLPTVTSIVDGDGDNKDSVTGSSTVTFTLAGTNFGTSQTSVNGAVRFIQVNENDPNNPWGAVSTVSNFTSWTNTSIQGSIDLAGGKYRVEISVRGENTTEGILYYKGAGTYEVIVGEPTPTPVPNTPSMILLNNGTFTMGKANDASPVHQVTLTHKFYMGKYEITNTEYCAFLYAQTYINPNWVYLDYPNPIMSYISLYGTISEPSSIRIKSGRENHPVEFVSWYGAVAYCNWLSNQAGLPVCYSDNNNDGSLESFVLNGGYFTDGYRLPSEAEWEYACRGGSTTNFYWGDILDPIIGLNKCWYEGTCNTGLATDVGYGGGHPWGLYDMSGNVNEWCSDSSDVYPANAVTDPLVYRPDAHRIIRGGSFYNSYWTGWSALRGTSPSDMNYGGGVGFRVCKNH
jgi:formylglycine-generating enzyme required for sulfatase activity